MTTDRARSIKTGSRHHVRRVAVVPRRGLCLVPPTKPSEPHMHAGQYRLPAAAGMVCAGPLRTASRLTTRVTTAGFFPLNLVFFAVVWGFRVFCGQLCRNLGFVALQVFSALYYHFADDTNLRGIEKPVAMNPMIFIVLLFHKTSAFSIADI